MILPGYCQENIPKSLMSGTNAAAYPGRWYSELSEITDNPEMIISMKVCESSDVIENNNKNFKATLNLNIKFKGTKEGVPLDMKSTYYITGSTEWKIDNNKLFEKIISVNFLEREIIIDFYKSENDFNGKDNQRIDSASKLDDEKKRIAGMVSDGNLKMLQSVFYVGKYDVSNILLLNDSKLIQEYTDNKGRDQVSVDVRTKNYDGECH